MNFELSTDQRLLEETVARLLRERWTFDKRSQHSSGPKGFNTATWRLMAEIGLLGVPFSSVDGGHDGGGTELMILHRAFGRGLAQEPFLATVVLGGGMIANAGSAEQRAAVLPDLISGQRLLALAYLEPSSGYNPLWVETQALRDGAGYVLNGRKAVVLNGDSADLLVITARTSGRPGERDGISAFLVEPGQPGLQIQAYATIDGRRAAEVHLDGVRVDESARLGNEGTSADVLELVLSTASAALCAESVGAMEAACELTLDYLKTREQFGVPIGRFQVLQHRMVDMRIALEKATSMTVLAFCSLRSPPVVRDTRVSAAKWLVGKTGKFVGEQAIQMHGGMGMSNEAAVSHYAKSLVMCDHWFGDQDYHLERFVALDRTRPLTEARA
jgi:alkylation response protein AidB-like acyl-CoA dehydrogenase